MQAASRWPDCPRRTSAYALAASGALALLVLQLGACTTTRPVLAPESVAPGSMGTIGDVRVDLQVVGDAGAILGEAASEALSRSGVACPSAGGEGCTRFDLRATLREPAAAFRASSPPLRIVELVATAADRSAAPRVYQRTIATSGNLSTATWMRVADALATDLADELAFRQERRGMVVHLPAWAATEAALGRTSSPRSFHVAITGDVRADADIAGRIGGVPLRLARPATEYLTEAIADELRAAGHALVPAMGGRLVGSQLEKFWVNAESVGGAWRTSVEVELDLEVSPPPGERRRKPERHRCRAENSTSRAPTEGELAQTVHTCLAELLRSVRSDAAWR